ncbi:MAG: SMP-30/gluconolactonase/LRE family protein, partial [Cyanobacteria bacterium REEB65]|nr:SMP-30/gluconolactonase/LRE family protein [Cyanobacteria bacterium REEB65]
MRSRVVGVAFALAIACQAASWANAAEPQMNTGPIGLVVTFSGGRSPIGRDAGGFADGPAWSAEFHEPAGIGVDLAGNVYVADQDNCRIRKIAPDGSVTTLAGDGTRGYRDGPGDQAEFDFPDGLAVDGMGTVYVADRCNHRLREIAPDGYVTTLAGSDPGSQDGSADEARFSFPSGIAIDAWGRLYVSDSGNARIRRVDPDGNVKTIAGSVPGYSDGRGPAALFRDPEGLAIDSDGTLYVADAGNNRIRRVDSDGVVETVAGSQRGWYDGPQGQARFDEPTGIALDRRGSIFVADTDNHCLRVIGPDGIVR